ncbi:hypothetical protein L3X38_006058 [Prunus dulcis]|uniref:Protein kinase domain-containing protein n=1 Tax=Prunus dulcis TaxID=3755 RepID=A0AAD5F4T6_PRUDU|nr:hypothetical protein L3X38_006058 [Prunus dulcis]
MAPVALFIFSLLTHLVVLHSIEELKINKGCSPEECQTNPPECGWLFTVNCSDRDNPRIQLKEEGYWHEFEIIPEPNMIFINDRKLEQRLKTNHCNDQVFNDLRLPDPSPVFDELFAPNLTLIKCSTPLYDTELIDGCRNHNYTYYTTSPDHSLLKECHVDKGKFKCSVREKGDKLGLTLGLAAGAVAGLMVLVVIVCCLKRKLAYDSFIFFWKNQGQDRQIVEAFLRSYGPLQGKSNDGSLVAVKVLSKLKDSPNRDHDHHLGWEQLDQISLGIARGLEYLHRGCNARILHFDIKPHNILLDENFTPKVSDFGLAKICNMKESIVSMACARGTAGYIAPEVFCRNFGGVSHKSDVYSYGMMLSEMVGGRRNINAEAEDTSEIYFPHWIYKRLELDEELGLPSIMKEEDKVRARKMIIVSLWCIQTDPSNRPAMKEVIDMLEGSVDCLQIPPKPYLSSPPKPVADSSTVTLVSIE